MNNNTLFRKANWFPLLVFMVLVASCKKDDLKSEELLVYLQPDKTGIATKTQVMRLVHTPVGIEGDKTVDLFAYATREVPADVDITVAPDASLLAAYNAENKTSCVVLPADAYKLVNTAPVRIANGSLKSDPLKVEITKPETLTNPAGYILPLAISRVDSKDKGALTSTTHKAVFLKVTYEYNNVKQTQAPVTGTTVARTGWVATVSNTTTGALGPAMLDGSNTTSWRSSNTAGAAKWASIDMVSVRTLKGFQIVPNYVSVSENAVQMTVSTSTDNTIWTVQGVWNGSGPLAGSTAAIPDIKGVEFYSPVSARYVRFDITVLVSGNRVGFAEVNAIQ